MNYKENSWNESNMDWGDTEINELIKNINSVMDIGTKNLDEEALKEIHEHISIIIKQGIFWLNQENPQRYIYDLRNFLLWMCDFVEGKDAEFWGE